MRILFDFIKDAMRKIDGYWIESAGHPIVIKGKFTPQQSIAIYSEDRGTKFEARVPVLIYGFYDFPVSYAYSTFGIDAPDELTIQVNAENLIKKAGEIPVIGTLLWVEQSDWLVINRAWIYNRFVGKYRLEFTCQRYHESVTTGKNGVYMQTQSGHTMELDDEE